MKNKVKIVGVPLDLGTNKLGVDMGPTAIRYADLKYALSYNKIEFDDYGDLIVEQTNYNNIQSKSDFKEEIANVSEKLAELTYSALLKKQIPVILGGDHSTSIGSIAGASKKANRLGVLWLDTHPDANTPEISPSGNIHGMSVAVSLGHGYPELVNCLGFSPKVLPEDICMVGINDIDEAEGDFLKKLGVNIFTLMDIERMGIVQVIEKAFKIITHKTDAVHVSFDVDVLDPLFAPGTGIISRGGLTYREISYIMKSLGEADILNSIDIIEVNPLLDIQNITAELAVEMLIAALGGSFSDYQRKYLKAHGS